MSPHGVGKHTALGSCVSGCGGSARKVGDESSSQQATDNLSRQRLRGHSAVASSSEGLHAGRAVTAKAAPSSDSSRLGLLDGRLGTQVMLISCQVMS